jgi:hypothetical protein
MSQEILKQLEILQQKVDALTELVENLPIKKQKKPQGTKSIDEELKDNIEQVFHSYKDTINKRARLTKKSSDKIKKRLSEYSADELLQALENFAADDWWMQNNAHRGIAWFFHSEDRIDQFLNLKPQKIKKKIQLLHDNQPCKWNFNKLQIFASWSNSWLDWNQNHPQYELFELKEGDDIVKKGKEAYQAYINSVMEKK